MKSQDFEKQGVLSGSFETNLKYFGQLSFTAPLVMYQSAKKLCSASSAIKEWDDHDDDDESGCCYYYYFSCLIMSKLLPLSLSSCN